MATKSKKTYCFKDKKGRMRCTKRFVVRQDATPYVQDPDTGLMLGRVKKRYKKDLE